MCKPDLVGLERPAVGPKEKTEPSKEGTELRGGRPSREGEAGQTEQGGGMEGREGGCLVQCWPGGRAQLLPWLGPGPWGGGGRHRGQYQGMKHLVCRANPPAEGSFQLMLWELSAAFMLSCAQKGLIL